VVIVDGLRFGFGQAVALAGGGVAETEVLELTSAFLRIGAQTHRGHSPEKLRRTQDAPPAAAAPATAPGAAAAPSQRRWGGVDHPAMRFMGYSAREFLRIGFAAAVFFLMAKFLVPKANVPALTTAVEKL
jgi:hypothetical protein